MLHMFNQNNQAIDVLDSRFRSIAFDVPAGDMIHLLSINASSTRVLLTIGGIRHDLWMAGPATSWHRRSRHWDGPS